MASEMLTGKDMYTSEQLNRVETAQSVNISMEMFEKLYLSPENKVKGDLRKTFGNPTPLPLLGFLIASSPLAAALMGWQGAGGGGAATIGTYYFFGGMLQVIGSILECDYVYNVEKEAQYWREACSLLVSITPGKLTGTELLVFVALHELSLILRDNYRFIGNTFPFIVFGSFGAFWLAFAATLTPAYNAEAAFTASATTAAEKAAGIASFEASLAFFLLFMGILVFMYLICSLRINIVFFLIFLFLDIALFLLTGAYWQASKGHVAVYEKLAVATGACVFVLCVFGWYLLFAQLLQSVEFPLDLPVGDLSSKIKSKRHRAKNEDVEKRS